MATNKPKLTLEIGVPRRVKLLRNKPYNGTNSTGEYHLYSVADAETGEEMAFFAQENTHKTIEDLGLKAGVVIQLTRVNGRVDLAVVGSPAPEQLQSDNLKEILAGCIRDTLAVVKDCGIQWSNEEVERLVVAMFIARSR